MAEGSWKMTAGIFDRLRAEGVEQEIKDAYWSNAQVDPAAFRAVWKNVARPKCPSPYAIYSVVTDLLLGQSSGCDGVTSYQYRQALVQFTCHSLVRDGQDETAAIFVAGKIVDAMENGKLSFAGGTKFITLTRRPDIESRDDDENAVIGIQFAIDYELLVDLARLHA